MFLFFYVFSLLLFMFFLFLGLTYCFRPIFPQKPCQKTYFSPPGLSRDALLKCIEHTMYENQPPNSLDFHVFVHRILLVNPRSVQSLGEIYMLLIILLSRMFF